MASAADPYSDIRRCAQARVTPGFVLFCGFMQQIQREKQDNDLNTSEDADKKQDPKKYDEDKATENREDVIHSSTRDAQNHEADLDSCVEDDVSVDDSKSKPRSMDDGLSVLDHVNEESEQAYDQPQDEKSFPKTFENEKTFHDFVDNFSCHHRKVDTIKDSENHHRKAVRKRTFHKDISVKLNEHSGENVETDGEDMTPAPTTNKHGYSVPNLINKRLGDRYNVMNEHVHPDERHVCYNSRYPDENIGNPICDFGIQSRPRQSDLDSRSPNKPQYTSEDLIHFSDDREDLIQFSDEYTIPGKPMTKSHDIRKYDTQYGHPSFSTDRHLFPNRNDHTSFPTESHSIPRISDDLVYRPDFTTENIGVDRQFVGNSRLPCVCNGLNLAGSSDDQDGNEIGYALYRCCPYCLQHRPRSLEDTGDTWNHHGHRTPSYSASEGSYGDASQQGLYLNYSEAYSHYNDPGHMMMQQYYHYQHPSRNDPGSTRMDQSDYLGPYSHEQEHTLLHHSDYSNRGHSRKDHSRTTYSSTDGDWSNLESDLSSESYPECPVSGCGQFPLPGTEGMCMHHYSRMLYDEVVNYRKRKQIPAPNVTYDIDKERNE